MLKYRDKFIKLKYQMGGEAGKKNPSVRPKAALEKAKVAKEQAAKEAAKKSTKSRNNLCTSVAVDAQYDTKKFKDSYSTVYPSGEFSEEDLKLRTLQLAPDVIVKHDVGLNFYRVQCGDTLNKIKEKLSKFASFAYLKDLPKDKIKGFNIPPEVLQPNTWIPLPQEVSLLDKYTDEKLAQDCKTAIDAMKVHPLYKAYMEKLLTVTDVDHILALMLACARNESGKGPLGQFAPFRYEKSHKSFSYTTFHVLMTGAGLKARQKLGMTEGQVLLPRNAAKLFLAFLIEKSPNNFTKFFPLDDKMEAFSYFYNGNWKKAHKKEIVKVSKRNAKLRENVEKAYMQAVKKNPKKKIRRPEIHYEVVKDSYPVELKKNYDASKLLLGIK